jgi:hypothetical protein
MRDCSIFDYPYVLIVTIDRSTDSTFYNKLDVKDNGEERLEISHVGLRKIRRLLPAALGRN